MSLITLRSQNSGVPGSVSESAAYIRNYFKEEITFQPGDTFELVSISITKIDKFEIVQGQNDRLVWRIGAGPSSIGGTPNFSQHVVTIPGGGYNGAQFAQLLQNLMNQSVMLGNFSPDGSGDATKGGFEVIFTAGTAGPPTSDAKFSISYYQQDLPSSNGDTLTISKELEYAVGGLSVTQDTTNNVYNLEVSPGTNFPNSPRDITTLSNGVYGSKSVFPNGGEVSVIIEPVKGLDTIPNLDFTTGGASEILNYDIGDGAGPQDFDIKFDANSGLSNDWEYNVELFDGTTGTIATSILENHGRIDTTSLVAAGGGDGYNVDDTGNLTGGTGTGATYKVLSVSAADGAVLSYEIVAEGIGYVVGDILTLDGDFEVGAQIQVDTLLPTAGGTGYAVGDEGDCIPVIGTGTGAKFKVLTISANGQGEILTYELTNTGGGYNIGDTADLVKTGGSPSNALIRIKTIATGSTNLFGYVSDDGLLGLATTDGADATKASNWNRGFFYYNVNTKFFQGFGDNGVPTEPRPKGTIKRKSGSGYDITLRNIGYATCQMGVARNQLILGKTQYPGNASASLSKDDGGYDIQFSVLDDGINDDIAIFCDGFIKGGQDYPIVGWRDVKKYINTDDEGDVYNSSDWDNLPQGPAPWATFDYPNDNIKVRMERYGIDKTRVYISHDSSGDGAFQEEVVVLQQNDVVESVKFAPNIREVMYPFVPVTFFAKGSRFGTTKISLGGIYDLKRIDSTDSVIIGSNYTGNPHAPENIVGVIREENNSVNDYSETGPVSGPQSQVQLSSMWKWGLVEAGEDSGDTKSTYNSAGQGGPGILNDDGDQTLLTGRSLAPNYANMNNVLGFLRWNTFKENTGTSATITTAAPNVPQTNLLEPSLMVEFPDFNIKSFSGESSDTGRAIAVIPREQWTTNEKTGTLIYVAPYPIQIDLGIPNRMTLNELTCRLRQADGLLADDLLHPTEITIRKREGDEQKQQRIMTNVMKVINMERGNIHDSNISNFNNNMPKI